MPQMPKAANVTAMPPRPQQPAPVPPRPSHSSVEHYAEEALRSAQRVIDQMREIDALAQDVADWQRKALMAEAEIKRLEKREADLTEELDRRTTQLTDERDSFRLRLAHMVSQFQTAGNIILGCLNAAEGAAGTPKINLQRLADEIEDHSETPTPPEDPLPRVATAGPRDHD